MCISVLSLLALTADRDQAIHQHLSFKQYLSLTRRAAASSGIWILFLGRLYHGRGPYRVVVSTSAFHVRGSARRFKEAKMFLHHSLAKLSILGSLHDREVANFESCVWRAVSSHSSHHSQELLLAQFSLYVKKGGLKPHSFPTHPLIYLEPGLVQH